MERRCFHRLVSFGDLMMLGVAIKARGSRPSPRRFFSNFHSHLTSRCADRASCEHMCCKRGLKGVEGGGAQEGESLEKLRARGDAACDARDWKSAVTAYGRAVYLYVDRESWVRFRRTIKKVEYSAEERQQLECKADGGDPEAMFLGGYLCFWGWGGYAQERRRSHELFSRAMSRRHVYAEWQSAYQLRFGWGCEKDKAAARAHHRAAADAGCAHACGDVAQLYRDSVGGPKDLHLAALYYQRAISLGWDRLMPLNELKRYHPMEIAPWGRWNEEVHSLVPDVVHAAMFAWLMTAYSLRFPKPLRMTVAEYICTRSEW